MTIDKESTANEIRERDAAIGKLFTYLDNHHVCLDEYDCFVAVTEDKATLFWCNMLVDGSPERCEHDPRHMDWGEVTAPMDQEYLDAVNEVFGTAFRYEKFAGR